MEMIQVQTMELQNKYMGMASPHRGMESIFMHLQNAPIYYAKYKKEEIEVKALMLLIKEGGVPEVTTKEVNIHEHEECNIGTLLRR